LIERELDGNYDGVLMLLSPCLRADNEEKDLRQLASLGNVPGVGSLAWLTVNPMLKRSMGGRLPDDQLDDLVAEMKRNSREANRRILQRYFAHFADRGKSH
jgi:hypothetical protein